MKTRVYSQYRNAGKMFAQFTEFIGWCRAGKRIELHGVDYVAVDRQSWREMQNRLRQAEIITTTFFNEELRDD